MSDETNANPFYLTLGAAAKHAGLSKATISRAIRLGKLSAQRCPDTHSFKIDPAELQRYTETAQVVRAEQAATPGQTAEPPPQTALIEERAARELAEARLSMTETQVADLRATLADMRAEREDLRRDRDAWKEQASQAMRLALPAPQHERRGLWRWWRRRAG